MIRLAAILLAAALALACAGTGLIAAAAWDGPPPAFDPRPPLPATVERVKDGDTFVATLTYELDRDHALSARIVVRIENLNAPDHEPGKAAATEALEALLNSGTVWLQPVGKASLERTVCRVWVEREGGGIVDVAEELAGEAVEWGK